MYPGNDQRPESDGDEEEKDLVRLMVLVCIYTRLDRLILANRIGIHGS